MSQLDDKINEHFSGLVVRKDLVKTVKGNAIVPSYVLEYLWVNTVPVMTDSKWHQYRERDFTQTLCPS